MVAVVAAMVGWRAVYLGLNMPAEEIAHAAEQIQARVVALSIVYPSDDARVVWELKKLRSFCAEGVALIVGGRGAEAHAQALDET
jgi:methylmalonyl-CoA mutase cobalamin-binding subunit